MFYHSADKTVWRAKKPVFEAAQVIEWISRDELQVREDWVESRSAPPACAKQGEEKQHRHKEYKTRPAASSHCHHLANVLLNWKLVFSNVRVFFIVQLICFGEHENHKVFFVSLFFRGVDVCFSIPETLKQLIAPFVFQVAPHSLVAFIFYFKGMALERRRRRIWSTGSSVATQTHQASREGEGHSRSKRGRWRTAVYSRCCEGGSKKLVFCVVFSVQAVNANWLFWHPLSL